MKHFAVALIILLLPSIVCAQAFQEDRDHDGIADPFEERLLQKFLPAFLIDAGDCDMAPAEFVAGSSTPLVLERNGTVYGQVFRQGEDGSKVVLEIHYYHLWARDCGRAGHSLDPEHVSVLVRAENMDAPMDAWKAVYWYAAAHERTICDVSNGAHAQFLKAEERGARVWISEGKHASFLSEARCGFGCGENRCRNAALMETGKLINIGEAAFPMNGAVWTGSESWILKTKMQSDFTPLVLAQLSTSGKDKVVTVNAPLPPAHAVLLGGNSTIEGLLAGNQSAGKALRATGRALKLAGRKVRAAFPETTP